MIKRKRKLPSFGADDSDSVVPASLQPTNTKASKAGPSSKQDRSGSKSGQPSKPDRSGSKIRESSKLDTNGSKSGHASKSKPDKNGKAASSFAFSEIFSKTGFTLSSGKEPNELSVDQTSFQKELFKLLTLHPGYPAVVEEFVEALLAHLESPLRLRQCLIPTNTSPECSSARSEKQDSLIRILFGIDALQMPLMSALLEKLPELAAFEECEIFDRSQLVENMPTLIMTQFRWLDRVVDSKALCDKMMEVLPLVAVDTQKEMICAFPDILNDQEHQAAAQKLCDLLNNQELNVAILDTLSNLNIHSDTVAEVKQRVMKTLQSVPYEHLPILVSFILQNTGQQDATMTVSDLRANLDFTDTLEPLTASTPKEVGKKINGPNKGVDFLVVEVLRSVLRFQKAINDAWIKAIEMVGSSTEHKPLDILALLVLDSLEVRRKSVESLLRNKIRAEHFTEELIHLTFSSHFSVVKEYFPSVLRLADILLKSVELVLSTYGGIIYQKAFAVSDTYCRQEVIGNLITHVGSGSIFEVNAALNTLTVLVQQYPENVAPFGTYIKNMLEYLEVLQLAQIRKVYGMLATLAFQGGREGALLQDDVQILIRKQLTNPMPKYQQMGVIGALMAVKAMSTSSNISRELSSITLSGNSSLTLNQKQAIGLLDLVQRSISRFPEVLALLSDELSRLLHRGDLDACVEGWINEMMVESFQDDFILEVEQDEPLPVCELIDLELRFDLDHSSKDAIAVNLMPFVVKEDLFKRGKSGLEAGSYIRDLKSISPLTLAPQFRLLRICETSQHNGSLSGIDAILGCPVFLPDSSLDDKFASLSTEQQHLICTGYFYCLNWFREVVNAFAASSVSDSEIKAKVVQRLRDVVDLQIKLQSFLAVTKNYLPPLVNYDFDCLESSKPTQLSLAAAVPTTRVKKGRKPAKKRKANGQEEVNDAEIEEPQTATVPPTARENSNEKNGVEKSSPKVADLVSYRPYLRELDLEVFLVLQDSVQIQQEDDETESQKLHPRELEFLLDDLAQKLAHILVTVKRQTFLKPRSNGRVGFSNLNLYSTTEVIGSMAKMMPTFCQLLEDCSGFFQTLIADNDGVVDGPGSNSEHTKQVASCMHFLLSILHSVLDWNGFVGENKSNLDHMLSVMVSRVAGNVSTQVPMRERFRRAFKYLTNFADSLVSLDCAVELIKVLEAMAEKASNEELRQQVSTAAENFLKRDWGKQERGAKHTEKIRTLLQVYFKLSQDSLGSLENISTVAMTELFNSEEKDATSTTFITLTRLTFSTYYSTSLHHLVEIVKKPMDSKESSMATWTQAIRIFHVLVNLVKVFSGRSNLSSCLKYGRQFLDTFLKTCMPLLDKAFRSHKEDVQSMLKNLQLSTRFLQHLCSHSKVIQDVTLTNHVPFLKKSLEFFVYRVKAMLALNNCKEAFWVGNLKNRDLQGEEILSQTAAGDDSDDGEEETATTNEENISDVEIEEEQKDGSIEESLNQDHSESE